MPKLCGYVISYILATLFLVNLKNYLLQLCVKQLLSITENATNNRNKLWICVRLSSFQKPQMLSVLRLFIYQCLFFYLLFWTLVNCYVLLVLMTDTTVWIFSDKFRVTKPHITTLQWCYLKIVWYRKCMSSVNDTSRLWKHVCPTLLLQQW